MAIEPWLLPLLHKVTSSLGYEDVNYKTGKFQKIEMHLCKIKPRWSGYLEVQRAWKMRPWEEIL